MLFFALAFPLLAAGQYLGLWLARRSHLFGHRSYHTLLNRMASDARLSIPTQAISYALLLLVTVGLFSLLWRRPFGEGVHWNGISGKGRAIALAALGLALGFGNAFLGNYLPMPKDPPIASDMMRSPLGAWLMLIFGVTAAPLVEEMAFRGFLLPGFVNAFRWLKDKGDISEGTYRGIGLPLSVVLTSLPFALMHAPQVSHAWGPLLLIGLVSAVLCTVRLATDSLASSTLVHAAYNFTLFAALLVQTQGFTHLERLKG